MSDRQADTNQERQGGLAAVGATLAAVREEQQRSLESVAADLHLRPAIIRAIENGDEAKLPVSTFLRGYVRSYARLLGLDDATLTTQLPVMDEYHPAPLRPVGMRRSGVSLPRGRWLVWGLGLVAVAVMVIYGVPALERLWSNRTVEEESDQLQLPLAESQESPDFAESDLLPEPDDVTVDERARIEAPVTEAGEAMSSEAQGDKPETGNVGQSEQDQAAAAEARVDDEKTPEPREAAPQTAGPAVIKLRFLEDSWVEMEANGRKLVVGTQPAGSERTVRAEPPIQILLGNAPGVELSYRGKTVDIAAYQRGKVARLTLED